MECINEYIYINTQINPDIHKSFCKTTLDNGYIYLTFGLISEDILSDLDKNSFVLQIRITKKYLKKYNESLDLSRGDQPVCCKMESKLLDILHCNAAGIYRKIFLESAVLFLLYQAQKNNFLLQQSCERCNYVNKPGEIDKIQKAKKYILDNLANNLTIAIIANNVGTNECYLKRGFKEVFGQTIFEFIQENRMIKAKHLLHGNNPKITDISYKVGYASLSSFSQSYKNFFGITPSQQIKQVFPDN
ncbi:MAG: helix-turn-helix transcriptional regulator [Saprospiraceae bacterium]|nr:helix-turn-helix transcriptional regulator [Saprospiraceae bacterium]